MASKRAQPEQQAPPAQWLRIQYSKTGPARFTSHRDFGRAFERALRRGQIPMAYSSGFNPHPRISYANASPTGASTQAEYLELGVSQIVDPAKLQVVLDAALPPGMTIERVVVSERDSLGTLLAASEWLVSLQGVDQATLREAVDALKAAESVEVERMTKNGPRRFDARAAVVAIEVAEPGVVRMVTLQQTPLVRPDDVVAAMKLVHPAFAPTAPPLLHRVAQGPLEGERVTDPLA